MSNTGRLIPLQSNTEATIALGSTVRKHCVKCLGLKVRVPFQHLPILVIRDQRYLFNCESSFEEATCSLVPQVMKMKVLDV